MSAGSSHDHGNCELCDQLDAERGALVAEWERAAAERDSLARLIEQMRTERDMLILDRGSS
jgi:cell division protein FtsB